MTTVYIAGPMRGYPRFNFYAFDEAARRLREQGYIVISPAEMDRENGFNPDVSQEITQDMKREFMRRDLDAIADTDAIALLSGWEKSAGVKVELALAEFLGLEILDATTGEPLNTDGTTPDPEIDRVVTLEVGQVFTGKDRDLCAVARELQDVRGAIFEVSFPALGMECGRGKWCFDSPVAQYRLVSMAPQDVSNGDESILDEAIRITSGDRQASYGPPEQDFQRTAAMWSQLLGVDVEARQVAMCMIALKLSRETYQSKRDNWVDIAGYAKCGSICN